MDILRGSLDTFDLADVLRLIASAQHTGALSAESYRLKGRVYVADGAITYATTRGEDGDPEDLERLRTFRSGGSSSRERRGRKSTGPTGVEDLVEQQVVEVLVRLTRMQGGRFSFEAGVHTRAYGEGSAPTFAIADILEQVSTRITDWDSIESQVPTANTLFRLNDTLADEEFEVTLDARSWRFLAAVGDSASVQDLAERLRIFEFPAAKKVAEFVRRGLLIVSEESVESALPATTGTAEHGNATDGSGFHKDTAPIAATGQSEPESAVPHDGTAEAVDHVEKVWPDAAGEDEGGEEAESPTADEPHELDAVSVAATPEAQESDTVTEQDEEPSSSSEAQSSTDSEDDHKAWSGPSPEDAGARHDVYEGSPTSTE